MFAFSSRGTLLVASGIAIVSVVVVTALALRTGQAEAQGILSTPACQCSEATAIPSISTNLVHCLCGGMSCVISEYTADGKRGNLMECVR